MTCKAGREVVSKLAVSSLTAIALMLGTALPARAQARQTVVDLSMIMVMTADGMNMYACEMTIVTTPTGKVTGQCTATLTSRGYAVTEALRSQGDMAMGMTMGPPMIMWMFMVDVEELPEGTAIVTLHT